MTRVVRAAAVTFPEWLMLREPADAAARAAELVQRVQPYLPRHGAVAVHDLGCGTGSMARWLAGRLPGPQRWVLYDHDPELLTLARGPARGFVDDGALVTVETRRRDISCLEPAELADADLVTASAVLDILTAAELDRLVTCCASAGRPTLMALTVTGQVELTPSDPLDQHIQEAFNAHQRRTTGAGRLLGPDAIDAAVEAFASRGAEIVLRPSAWRLGPAESALTRTWFTGWLSAAVEQEPALAVEAAEYAERRLAAVAAGRVSVRVHHQDLLALPQPTIRGSGRRSPASSPRRDVSGGDPAPHGDAVFGG